MDSTSADDLTVAGPIDEDQTSPGHYLKELDRLRNEFRSRLIMANLQTEAVRAGMVDLDGLKLINLSEAEIGPDDRIVDGQKILEEFRRRKPWLFGISSSSSVAEAPPSQPLRVKNALEMTDDEYSIARAQLTKRQY